MANYRGVDYRHVWVVTPTQIDAPPTGDQEFMLYFARSLRRANPTSVPEPGTLLLLSTSSLAAVAALRRRWMS